MGGGADERSVTEDGFQRIFQVNVLAPYLLTCLVPVPARLVYLTSGLEAQGEVHVDDLQFERRPWNGMQAYSDSKLWDVVLAFEVARHEPGTLSNAVDPGWIKTRMGGPGGDGRAPGRRRYPGVAGDQRGPVRDGHGTLPQPPPGAAREPGRERRRRAGAAPRDAAQLTGAQLPSR